MIKQGLYSDFEISSKTTGYFRISKDADRIKLEIQLKQGIMPNPDLTKQFTDACSQFADAEFNTVLYAYREFPYSVGLDYERKFKNI